jgi:hypothetical protein
MRRSLFLVGAAAVLAAACAKGERDEGAMADSAAVAPPAMAPMADAGVQKAVTIYRAIEADPAAAESVLAAHQLTRAGLDSLMYEIAADSARAAAYANAIR